MYAFGAMVALLILLLRIAKWFFLFVAVVLWIVALKNEEFYYTLFIYPLAVFMCMYCTRLLEKSDFR